MPDNTFTKVARNRLPDNALGWPGKTALVLMGDQLGVKYIIILNEDGTPHAWPRSLDGRVEDIVRKFG